MITNSLLKSSLGLITVLKPSNTYMILVLAKLMMPELAFSFEESISISFLFLMDSFKTNVIQIIDKRFNADEMAKTPTYPMLVKIGPLTKFPMAPLPKSVPSTTARRNVLSK